MSSQVFFREPRSTLHRLTVEDREARHGTVVALKLPRKAGAKYRDSIHKLATMRVFHPILTIQSSQGLRDLDHSYRPAHVLC